MKSTLIMMVKEPRAGNVKTRLAKGVGYGRATMLFRKMLGATIREATKGSWCVTLAVDPPGATRRFAKLLRLPEIGRGITLVGQSSGDLGDRLHDAIANAAKGPVVLIGGDAPQLRATDLRAAFEILREKDAVFGPATDGGFWLMGLAGRRRAPELFQRVRWSTEHTLTDTVATLPSDFEIGRLQALTDVDEAHDLCAVEPQAFLKSVARPHRLF